MTGLDVYRAGQAGELGEATERGDWVSLDVSREVAVLMKLLLEDPFTYTQACLDTDRGEAMDLFVARCEELREQALNTVERQLRVVG